MMARRFPPCLLVNKRRALLADQVPIKLLRVSLHQRDIYMTYYDHKMHELMSSLTSRLLQVELVLQQACQV